MCLPGDVHVGMALLDALTCPENLLIDHLAMSVVLFHLVRALDLRAEHAKSSKSDFLIYKKWWVGRFDSRNVRDML